MFVVFQLVELFIDGSRSSGEAACLAVKVFDVGAVADSVTDNRKVLG